MPAPPPESEPAIESTTGIGRAAGTAGSVGAPATGACSMVLCRGGSGASKQRQLGRGSSSNVADTTSRGGLSDVRGQPLPLDAQTDPAHPLWQQQGFIQPTASATAWRGGGRGRPRGRGP